MPRKKVSTDAQLALLDPITGVSRPRFDATLLTINFTLDPKKNALGFDLIFGSEEYPSFVNQGFQDGFGIYVNGINIAQAGGLPITINNPLMTATTGTELNGILTNGLVHFNAIVGLGSSGTLQLILADVGDGIVDTTVYLQGLAGARIPEPSSYYVGTLALAFGAAYGWRRRATKRR